MMLSRVLGAIGRFCISLGVLTLLFVAYQLWGTGILTAQAQGGLEKDFESLLVEADALSAALTTTDAEVADPAEPVEVLTEEDEASLTVDERQLRADAVEAARAAAVKVAAEAADLAAAELELKANLIWRPSGEAIAQMFIPAIDLEWTVVQGVGTEALRKGPGHYPSTPMPGMPGNAAIAGHRTTWGAPFNRIDELEPGDIITVKTLQGVFEYRVVEQDSGKGHFIVSPDRVDVLDQDFEQYPNRLTLTACHPKFSARQRIIVVAELIGEPAEYIPPPASLVPRGGPSLASEDFGSNDLPGDADLIAAEEAARAADDEPDDEQDVDEAGEADDSDDSDDSEVVSAVDTETEGPSQPQSAPLQGTTEAEDFGEGLNGDTSAIFPAVMWGLATAAIALAAGFVARRWKKWPTYALGFTPFAIVLFFCFVQIDQALPSY